MDLRRVVTGHDPQGRSVILSDQPLAMIQTPSSSVGQVWVSQEIPVSNDRLEDLSSRPLSLQPPTKGSQFWIVTIPPKGEGEGAANVEDLKRHTTATIDYLIVLQGEIELFLDEGKTILRQFDILVQRGTAHAWENVGVGPAVLAVILIDAVPVRGSAG
jgi:hypothetical protein